MFFYGQGFRRRSQRKQRDGDEGGDNLFRIDQDQNLLSE